MSSFEPLFGKSGRTRLTPRAVPTVATTRSWMPRPMGSPTATMPATFAPAFDDATVGDDDSDRAAEVALAQARQAELDATYLRGLNEGREQGEHAERARLRGTMMAAESALEDVRNAEARWLVNLEENLAAIAVGVAHQVILRDVTIAPDIVLDMVSRAVQEFGLDHALSIRVNPHDFESLLSVERTEGDPIAAITTGREVRWISDARIERGGCLVEGRERIVDGRVDTALERLYRRLTHTNA